MLTWFLRRRLAAFERRYAYDMSYARDMLAADPRALLAFARTTAIGRYRRDTPAEAYWAAKLVGTIAEDCGPCTQLVVAMALEDGVAPPVVTAVLTRDDARLPDAARLAARFARAALAHAAPADELRAEIERRWGPRAVVSLAFALTSARIYPTLKYALGHGASCQRVVLDGQPIAVARGAA